MAQATIVRITGGDDRLPRRASEFRIFEDLDLVESHIVQETEVFGEMVWLAVESYVTEVDDLNRYLHGAWVAQWPMTFEQVDVEPHSFPRQSYSQFL